MTTPNERPYATADSATVTLDLPRSLIDALGKAIMQWMMPTTEGWWDDAQNVAYAELGKELSHHALMVPELYDLAMPQPDPVFACELDMKPPYRHRADVLIEDDLLGVIGYAPRCDGANINNDGPWVRGEAIGQHGRVVAAGSGR